MSPTSLHIERTPLDHWAAKRLAVSPPNLSRKSLAQYQLHGLRETVKWARRHSPFYARRLAELPLDSPRSLHEIRRLPLTSPNDLVENAPRFLCVPQSEISRVVTVISSGTGGAPKRIFLTADDQELALDFFAHGVATLATRGDRMLIALPGEREGSVGFQLAKGISRAGVTPIPHGLILDPVQTLGYMERERATCIIGLPVQLLALVHCNSALADTVLRRLRSIILCSDHVPDGIINALRQHCDGEIFSHYGSSEMGLGGGLDCHGHAGYHMREVDLYFEIVSPETGEPLPDGELGEVVFTTLHRRGMPLIRYRTGDLSRILPGPCACGSILKRLENVRNRVDSYISLGDSGAISISMLDEVLFALPGLLDFSATVTPGSPHHLALVVYAPGIDPSHFQATINDALNTLAPVRHAFASSNLELSVVRAPQPFPPSGAKRKIEVHAAQ